VFLTNRWLEEIYTACLDMVNAMQTECTVTTQNEDGITVELNLSTAVRIDVRIDGHIFCGMSKKELLIALSTHLSRQLAEEDMTTL
jgi:riboflavin synthase alpha subunit